MFELRVLKARVATRGFGFVRETTPWERLGGPEGRPEGLERAAKTIERNMMGCRLDDSRGGSEKVSTKSGLPHPHRRCRWKRKPNLCACTSNRANCLVPMVCYLQGEERNVLEAQEGIELMDKCDVGPVPHILWFLAVQMKLWCKL